MNDSQIIDALDRFKDYLDVGSIFSDPFRWLGWVMIKGLALIVDGLESVTDDVLLIKKFFQNPEVVAFVTTIRPFLYILLAFSILYAGFMLIYQKKFDREGMAINLFIALIVIMVLSTGMEKANDFTDDAITAINTSELYDEGEGSLSENIISRNITDLVEFDKNNWSSSELTRPNTIPLSMLSNIQIKEKFDSNRTELNMSTEGKDLSEKYTIWTSSAKDLAKLDQGGLEWNNEYYYRYSVDWITLAVTLIIMAFTLFSIAYKLARLSFELAFNYILAIVVAPADIHDGQKTKKIIQAILNTFLVIILIFLSMKVYMIGTAYLANELTGLAYLVSLIAFSVAVVDGPNIVERLFGIDAGLKNGWGLLAGAYAGGKMVTGLGKGLGNMMKDGSSETNSQQQKPSRLGNGKVLSPNGNAVGEDGEKTDKVNQDGSGGVAGVAGILNKGKGDPNNSPSGSSESGETSENGTTTEDTKGTGSTGGTASVSSQLDGEKGDGQTRIKAPSPNDADRGSLSQQGQGGTGNIPTTSGPNSGQRAQGIQQSGIQTDADVSSVSDQVQGNSSVSNINSGGAPSPSTAGQSNAPISGVNAPTTSGSNSVQRAQGVQQSSVQTDTDITSVSDQSQGSTTVRNVQSGGSGAPSSSGINQSNAPQTTSGHTGSQATTGSNVRQTNTTAVNSSGGNVVVDDDVIVNENTSNTVQGTRNVSTRNSGGSPTTSGSGSNNFFGSGGSNDTVRGSSNSVLQQSTSQQLVQNETAVTHEHEQQVRTEETQNVNQRVRPRNYNVDGGTSNTVNRMRNFRNNDRNNN